MKPWRLGLLLKVVFASLLLAPSPALSQAPSLGTAASFGVLGGSAVTNTGPTTITGDLGVSPGTAVSGFPPGTVTGTIHSGDAVAQQAQSDVTTAYNVLAGLPCDTDLTGQDLGGLTLVSGVYCFSSSAQLTGTLTLDAQGDPTAEFIFQIGSTLTTASNSIVQVINSGESCNVHWQVGSSATIGTATSFTGNIVALTSITMTTGANLAGRLLARNGAVTLDSNDVSVCPAACEPIVLSPSTLPNGTLSVAYSETLTASGGAAPHSFSILAGSLPPGLTLAGGAINGTPTATGSFTFTVRATDDNDCPGSRVYTIVINPEDCATISLSPETLPGATVGVPYGPVIISATGGASPHTFAVTAGTIATGMTLSPSGVLSGTPTEVGSFTFTATATDAAGCRGSRIYTVLVAGPAGGGVPLIPAIGPWGRVAFILLLAATCVLTLRRMM